MYACVFFFLGGGVGVANATPLTPTHPRVSCRFFPGRLTWDLSHRARPTQARIRIRRRRRRDSRAPFAHMASLFISATAGCPVRVRDLSILVRWTHLSSLASPNPGSKRTVGGKHVCFLWLMIKANPIQNELRRLLATRQGQRGRRHRQARHRHRRSGREAGGQRCRRLVAAAASGRDVKVHTKLHKDRQDPKVVLHTR